MSGEDEHGISRRAAITALASLTIVAVAARVVALDRGLWFDEIVTLVESVRPPLVNILTAFPGTNNHPLYAVLAHASIRLFGEHVWSLRLPAVLFGVLTVPMIYALGTAITTRLEALLASALLATSYHHVWFSQNARGYSALLFWSLLSTLIVVKLAQRPRAGLAIAYGVVIACGLYTHVTIAFVPVAHALTWTGVVLSRSGSSERRRALQVGLMAVTAAVVVTAIFYAPMARQVYRSLSTIPRADAAGASPLRAFSDTVIGLRVGLGTIGVLAGLVLALLGTLSYARADRLAAALLLLPGALALGLLLITNSPMRPRFFFFCLGFAVFVVVRGAAEAGRLVAGLRSAVAPRAGATIGALLVGAMVLVSVNSLRYNYAFPKQDFEGARDFIETHRLATDVVAIGGLTIYPYEHYYRLPWSPVEKLHELEQLRARDGRLWLVYAFPEYIDPALKAVIQHDCEPKGVFHGTLGGGDLTVCRFTSGPAHEQ